MEYGKDHEGYWTGEHLARQLKEKAIDAFITAHAPGTQSIFIFDNSSRHPVFADDALVSTRKNLGPGGKNVPIVRDGWYLVNGVKTIQKMNDVTGLPKGMKAVLTERGINCHRLRSRCVKAGDHSTEGRCCMTKFVGSQLDFVERSRTCRRSLRNEVTWLCSL